MIFCQLESLISNHLQQIQKKKKQKPPHFVFSEMNLWHPPPDLCSFCLFFIYITVLTRWLNHDWGPILLDKILEKEFPSSCTA